MVGDWSKQLALSGEITIHTTDSLEPATGKMMQKGFKADNTDTLLSAFWHIAPVSKIKNSLREVWYEVEHSLFWEAEVSAPASWEAQAYHHQWGAGSFSLGVYNSEDLVLC